MCLVFLRYKVGTLWFAPAMVLSWKPWKTSAGYYPMTHLTHWIFSWTLNQAISWIIIPWTVDIHPQNRLLNLWDYCGKFLSFWVSEFSIRDIGGASEIPNHFTIKCKNLKTGVSSFCSNTALQSDLKALVEGSSPPDWLFDMLHTLIAYTQAIERCVPFKLVIGRKHFEPYFSFTTKARIRIIEMVIRIHLSFHQ